MSFRWQIGQFLLFIGLVGLAIFFITDQAKSPNYVYFCSGAIILVGGVYLMWLGRVPTKPSERFTTLRKMQENREKKKKKS
jgi:hypothetical protein